MIAGYIDALPPADGEVTFPHNPNANQREALTQIWGSEEAREKIR